ncbi:MAG: hypothetical protein Q7T20_00345 [Saprospiraceae bacterium]|nr:hypothetical protein [Saprospiraceae bacterium]
MKKTVKVQAYVWLKGFLLTILLHSGVSGFTAIPELQPVSCIIDDLQRDGPSQSSVSYSWSAVSGATEYKVYYVRQSDGYTSSVQVSSSTGYTSPVLSTGTYTFFFAAVCGNETLSYIADEVIIN